MRNTLVILIALFALNIPIAFSQVSLHESKPKYQQFLQRAVKNQFQLALQERSSAKATAIKERLIGSSGYDYTNPPLVKLTDSLRYIYLGSRGSVHSPYDDFRFMSYYDNYYFFFRDGRQNPSDACISYDTCYALVPVQTSPNTIARTAKQFDAAGYISGYLYQEINLASGKIVIQRKYQYTYDATHHCTKIVEQTDTSALKAGIYITSWINFSTYVGGQLMVDSSYNYLTGTPDVKSLYSYSGGNLIQQIGQVWSNGAWLNDTRELATYDASGRVIISQDNYAVANVFKLDVRDSFGYTGSSATATYDMSWARDSSGTGYRKQALFTIKLTLFGAIDSINKDVYSIAGVPSPSVRVKAFYNNAHHLTNVNYYKYAGTSWGTTPYLRSNFYYQSYNDATAVTPASSESKNVILYPMPVGGKEAHLRFARLPKNAPQVTIYDISGREMVAVTASPAREMDVPIESLQSGIYVVDVRWDGYEERLKMVKN